MNYEKIILEMLERIKDLEEKVDALEDFKDEFADDDANGVETGSSPSGQSNKNGNISGRNKARQEIANVLTNQYGFSVRKANRSEGSGLVATKKGKSFGIRISYSRSYAKEYGPEDVQCSGWHAFTKQDIENNPASFYIFVVAGEESEEYHYFIFTKESLMDEYFSQIDSPKKAVHMYFRVNRDGWPHEARDGAVDMTAHYNKWSIISG